MGILKQLSDNARAESLANQLRKKRFRLFRQFIADLPRPVRIIDIGGTEDFWKQMGCTDPKDVSVTIINITPTLTTLPNFYGAYGDARALSQFGDHEFDVAFSNSVIEHVGSFADQRQMAQETRRVAKRYFVQTPNFLFPIEPHFLFPGFQFLPRSVRILLIQKFSLGWVSRAPLRSDAENVIDHVRLLTKGELQNLFPNGKIAAERILGFAKSYTAMGLTESR